MHGSMTRQSFQSPGSIDQVMDLRLVLISFFELRIHLESLVDRDIQLLRDHLGDRIDLCIRKVHHTAYITDNTPRRQRTKSNDLNHAVITVLTANIINHFLSSFETEIHVDIRHGNSFRIQETLKQKVITDRVKLCDPKRISNQASCRRATSRSYHNVMISRIPNKIPHDQEVIHVTHVFDRGKLVIQAFFQLFGHWLVTLFQPFETKFIQIFPGSISLRNIKFWQFGDTKLNLYMTPLCNLMRILQSLCRIRKKPFHFLRRFYIILPAIISHSVFIGQFLTCLKAQQYIVRLCILCQCIMNVIGRNQFDPCLTVHLEQLLIYILLLGNSMILQFQEKVSLSKNILVSQCSRFCILIHPSGKKSRHFTRKTGTQSDQTFMIFFKKLQIHTRFIIETFHETFGHDFHQVRIALVIFCKKNKMVITIISAPDLTVKTGSRSHINLAAKDRIDPCCPRRTVKIDHTIHDTMIRNGSRIHTKFFHARHIFSYLVGAVQKTVLRMCV